MSTPLETLKAALDTYKTDQIQADLDNIQKRKDDVYDACTKALELSKAKRYIHDDNVLILSAPHIIIGNVDAMGNLISSDNLIEIRSNTLSLHGVGPGGIISTKAPTIEHIAVNPGSDGLTNTIEATSSIKLQSRGVGISATNDQGSFADEALFGNGISLITDSALNLQATPSCKEKKRHVEERIAICDTRINELKTAADKKRQDIDQCIDTIEKLMNLSDDLLKSESDLRTNQQMMSILQNEYKLKEQALISHVTAYIQTVSEWAESKRTHAALTQMKDDLQAKEAQFKDDVNTSKVTIQGERISIETRDGDNNVKTHANAGLTINAPHVRVSSYDNEHKLIEGSDINLSTQQLNIDTIAPGQPDNNGESEAKLSDKGHVTITTKTVLLQGIDQKVKQEEGKDKYTETAIAKDSRLSVLMEHIDMGATQTADGKIMGDITLNAKDITLHAMDQDIDQDSGKRSDKEMAAETKLTLQAADIVLGNVKDEDKSQSITLKTDKLASTAKTSISLTQGEDKATLKLEGGKINEKADSTEIDSKTTIKQATELKDKLTGTKAEFKTVKATSKLKGPKIDD